ncbi:MAG TPA: nuclear transport factor 2 family protein [Polaromonas sp.]|uniref:nuclear transport factor 2 family protein n=1 Tax=Polaromonas sp. TaxID=1869339 RepID=UPI002D42B59F|nr:nuclear transport factor 2 family protein [Polaromonas sp.]HYW56647.1 nuclear transport factor 2 family protein [Polaromonas sp.]
MNPVNNNAAQAVSQVLKNYFEGLYRCDTQLLRQVFHPAAIYACATDGELLTMGMAEYFPIVDKRVSPASRGDARTDRIVSIDFVGPVTALAKVQCSIVPKHFTDLLSMVFVENRWQIIAKVFHYELEPAPGNA